MLLETVERRIRETLTSIWDTIPLEGYTLEITTEGVSIHLSVEKIIKISIPEALHLFNSLKDFAIPVESEEKLATYILIHEVGHALHEERKMLNIMKVDLLRECRLSLDAKEVENFVEFYQQTEEIMMEVEIQGWKLGFLHSGIDINKEEYINVANHCLFTYQKSFNQLLFVGINSLLEQEVFISEEILKNVHTKKENEENLINEITLSLDEIA